MIPEPLPATRPEFLSFPRGFWLLWALAIALTAVWMAWPAVWGGMSLDSPRLLITCGLVGAGVLLVLTVVEMRLAPWRFVD